MTKHVAPLLTKKPCPGKKTVPQLSGGKKSYPEATLLLINVFLQNVMSSFFILHFRTLCARGAVLCWYSLQTQHGFVSRDAFFNVFAWHGGHTLCKVSPSTRWTIQLYKLITLKVSTERGAMGRGSRKPIKT